MGEKIALKFGISLEIVYNNILSDFGSLEKWQVK
jgi:hypothetical protein